MKKLLFILLIISLKVSAQPATPTGYNFINSKYDWLEGKFRTLHIPSGGATPTLYNGWTGAGAVYWDSVGKKFYIWDGAAWGQITGGGGGGVTSVATTAPITGGPITTTGTIGITQAGAAANGYLSSTDWNTFNNKAPAISVGTYTTRIALSPSNGLEFFQTDDGRNSPAGKYYYLDGVWNHVPMAPEDFWYYFNDFSATSQTNALSPLSTLNNEVSGAGATISFTTGNNFFQGLMSTGTASNGYSKINPGQTASPNTGFKANTNNMYYQITITSVSQKSNLSDVFNIDAGFTNQGNGNPPTSGYFFRYDSTTSANWLYRNGSGALTSTGIVFAAATPYTLEVFVRSDSVFYWINNSIIASEATNQNSTFYAPYTRIIKSLGSTACTMSVDYIKIWARLQSSRTNYGN